MKNVTTQLNNKELNIETLSPLKVRVFFCVPTMGMHLYGSSLDRRKPLQPLVERRRFHGETEIEERSGYLGSDKFT